MTRGAKMLMLAREPNRRPEYPDANYPRMDYPRMNYPRMDYTPYAENPEHEWETTNANYGDTEARFRDRRGREHYDNGRYAPKGAMEPEDAPESRRYRRDDAGRFRSEYPYTPLVPPVYRGDVMNRIGFAAEPEMEIKRDYRTDISYPHMDEMGHRTSETMMGHAKGGSMELTEDMAHEWMEGLRNEDGTTGPHWTMDQVKQVMSQRNIKGDPVRIWVAMNASYSDLCAIAKKHGINKMDFYIDYANAFWLNDKDAVDDKMSAYFLNVVK